MSTPGCTLLPEAHLSFLSPKSPGRNLFLMLSRLSLLAALLVPAQSLGEQAFTKLEPEPSVPDKVPRGPVPDSSLQPQGSFSRR